eukprot:TRINITY_DN13538_c0_g1_i1.p1 TRINITY_DN13538_c0_g1~~TRINITY_DN13538_c0_g1_i1.p1  ORF type:complete len:320 (-),score=41.92 TRINITY_DN13538_c0_g1_i1:356-1315(-)
MQGLHFSYGLGAFISPIMVAKIGYGSTFFVLSVFTLILLLPLLIIQTPTQIQKEEQIKQKNESLDLLEQKGELKIVEKQDQSELTYEVPDQIAKAIAAFLFIYVGLEVGFGGWISTYAVQKQIMGVNEAAYGTSVFWCTITIGRLAAVFLTMFLNNKMMLTINTIGCILSSILMLFIQNTQAVVYFGGAILGFFMSSIFPLAISQPVYYKMKTSNQIMSTFVISGSFGEMMIPWFMGKLIDWFGPLSLLISSLVISILMLVIFIYTVKFAEDFLQSQVNAQQRQEMEMKLLEQPKASLDLEYSPIQQKTPSVKKIQEKN